MAIPHGMKRKYKFMESFKTLLSFLLPPTMVTTVTLQEHYTSHRQIDFYQIWTAGKLCLHIERHFV
ncbi:MAG: hypothetical protein CSA81_07655 [Acidobacteria bacterium]|nr:MAG: hypothetical protein CSA81_07655 [Acidobacteriota bacterium]